MASPFLNTATDGTDPGYRKAMVDLYATVSDTGDRRGFVLPVETGQFVYGGINRAEYPRVYLNPARPVSPKGGGATVACTTEANVLAAIRSGGGTSVAVGDLVTIAPAVDVRTAFNLKTMAGDALPGTQNVVTVQALGWSKPEGVRVGPSDRVNMAKMTVVANGNAPVMSLTPGSGGGWRFIGIDFRVDAAVTTCSRIVQLGNGNLGTQTTATIPFNVTFEQCYFDAHPTCDILRAVEPNARAFQFLDCYFGDDIHSFLGSGDCQAWDCWNTDGPFQCANCRIVGSSEGIALGGGTNQIGPIADGDIWGNLIEKPASWNPAHASYNPAYANVNKKNGMEIKFAQHIRIRGNHIRQIKQNNQNPGWPVYVKDEHYSDTSLGVTRDILVQYNHGSEIESGPTTRGTTADGHEILHNTEQVVFYSNLWEVAESPWQCATGAAAYTSPGPSLNHAMLHETCIGLGALTYGILLDGNQNPPSAFSTGKPTNLTILDCIFEGSSLGIKTGGQASGNASLAVSTSGVTTITGNLFVGLPAASNPSGNSYPATVGAVGYTNRAGRDYSLSTGPAAPAFTSFQVVTQPAGAVSGVVMTTQPAVRALDQFSATWTAPLSVTINKVSGVPALSTQTVTTVAGVAQFTTITATNAGTVTMSANAGAISVTLAPVTVTSVPIIPPPPVLVPTTFSVVTMPSTTANGAVMGLLKLGILDQNGALLTTSPIAVTINRTHDHPSVSGTVTKTSVAGYVQFDDLVLSSPAQFVPETTNLRATAAGMTSMALGPITVTVPPTPPPPPPPPEPVRVYVRRRHKKR